ncbi:hypothetical protein DW352_00800 [Pseudolabrys taiwanensis]|uniref:4Fe4S-binding SPASM domain-containing protein n=2 Tax=Pseudolabrys taiwanensis TaxID=331696 RepID=A0A345ZQI5_9HYPH|nr:hypothetical protein DW352_00800 [Pseudolabrys taiwanensis]
MTQRVYEVNHVGGNLQYAMDNARRVSELVKRHKLEMMSYWRFIKFEYNVFEEEIAKAFAEEIGFFFEALPGVGDPKVSDQRRFNNQFYIAESDRGRSLPSPEMAGQTCRLMMDQVAIDSAGDVFLCCAMPNVPALKIGAYLEMPEHEVLRARLQHNFCRSCTNPRRVATEEDRERIREAGLELSVGSSGLPMFPR